MALVPSLETEPYDQMRCDHCNRVFLTQERLFIKCCPYCMSIRIDKECEMEFVAGEIPLVRLGELEDEVQGALSELSNIEDKFEDLAGQIRKMKEKYTKEIKEKPDDKSRSKAT